MFSPGLRVRKGGAHAEHAEMRAAALQSEPAALRTLGMRLVGVALELGLAYRPAPGSSIYCGCRGLQTALHSRGAVGSADGFML